MKTSRERELIDHPGEDLRAEGPPNAERAGIWRILTNSLVLTAIVVVIALVWLA